MKMKLCFFGLGSIGKRHLKNFMQIAKEYKIQTDIHVFRTTSKEVDGDTSCYIDRVIRDEKQIDDNYDVVFVTNPTSLHFQTIKLMENRTKHLFVEKPVFDNTNYDIDNLQLNENGIHYIARPLVHCGVIKTLKELLREEMVYSARAICSSYLPNWRPDTDYRNVYSAKKELGGGVSIDLIHEWDYITHLFGFPTKIFNLQGKFSNLEINSEDLSIYIAQYKDKLVELHLDYFGKETRRNIELLTKDGNIYADLTNKKISFSDGRKEIAIDQNEDMYINEMRYFVDKIINGQGQNEIERAVEVLKLTKGDNL